MFTPTWLYIKRHRKTNLRYFGKTIRDPNKYNGSGKYWISHLKTHGRDVETLWCGLFINEDELVEFATSFSKENDIVESINKDGRKIWANVVPEDGKQGGQNAGMPNPMKGMPTGRPCVWKGKPRPEHAALMKGRKQSKEHVKKRAESLSKHKRTKEHSNNISKSKKGIPNPKLSAALKGKPNKNKGKQLKVYPCAHCGFETTGGNLKRWHNDNCKLKGE